jgi:hypothetical protein
MPATLKKVSASSHTVTVKDTTFYFSYETIIAVETSSHPTLPGVHRVREENRWSRTTGKHFSQLGVKDFTILGQEEFAEFVKALG